MGSENLNPIGFLLFSPKLVPNSQKNQFRHKSPMGAIFRTYIHTYIHTLLARPHGAFKSQFYITKLKTKYVTMIKEDKS